MRFNEWLIQEQKGYKRSEILSHWTNIPPGTPLQPRPIPDYYHGSSIQQDSIRISGSQFFIDGVLARLKNLLTFENQSTKLGLVYKPLGIRPGEAKPTQSFVCYVSLKER